MSYTTSIFSATGCYISLIIDQAKLVKKLNLNGKGFKTTDWDN